MNFHTNHIQRVAHTRYAALIDLDNALIVRGDLMRPAAAEPILLGIDAIVAGMPRRAACGISVLKAHMSAIGVRGWGLTSVSPTPDAADRVLFMDGRDFVACGVTDLIVVSGDGFFTDLAAIARLHVVAPHGCLNRHLEIAATSVTYLPDPATTVGTVAA